MDREIVEKVKAYFKEAANLTRDPVAQAVLTQTMINAEGKENGKES